MTPSHEATTVSDVQTEDLKGCVNPLPRKRSGLLISIQPRYAAAIFAGYKKVELRRRPPKSHPPVVVIYGSGSERSVLGTARLQAIHTATPDQIWEQFGAVAGVSRDEFNIYFAGADEASALELDAVELAAQRLPLDDLRALGLEPPQSWRYVDAEQLGALISALHARARIPIVRAETPQSLWEPQVAMSPRPLRPLGRAWQGIKPLASLSLRCIGLGIPVRFIDSALYEAATFRRHHANGTGGRTAARPWRDSTGLDS